MITLENGFERKKVVYFILSEDMQVLEGELKIKQRADAGGSHLSHTAVKPDSRLAQIFVAKFLCIIKLIIITG